MTICTISVRPSIALLPCVIELLLPSQVTFDTTLHDASDLPHGAHPHYQLMGDL
jgi:hypothetical protein